MSSEITIIDADPDKGSARFVELVTSGVEPVEAARQSGMNDPTRAAYALVRDPSVRKALAVAADARLLSVAVPMALGVVEDLLRDKTLSAAIRGKLAIAVLDRAQKVGADPGRVAKSLQDMSREELAAYIREHDQASQPIDITPAR